MNLYNVYRLRYKAPGSKEWEYHDEEIAALSVRDALDKFDGYNIGVSVVQSIYKIGEVRI